MGRVIPKRINILGVNVSAIDMPMALEVIDGWIANREPNYVCIRDVNGVMACQEDEEFRKIHNLAGMVTPDGMPLVWASRLLGFRQVKRVSGVDLMMEVCAHSVSKGYRHFFYGCEPHVLEDLETKLKTEFPGLEIVGKHSPPFRPLTEAEDEDVVRMINKSEADIIWVGLGTPKQERWMADHIGRLKASVLIGNGAALDFLSGNLKRAPVWMQRSGLEWFHRLASEPRRLWRRYLVTTPRFIPLALLQILGLRRYPLDADDVAGADSTS